jgi:hypothetical protein
VIRLSAVGIACLICAAPATAHLAYKPACKQLGCVEKSQERNLAHAEYVLHHGAHAHRRWARKAVVWLARELHQSIAWLQPPRPAPRIVYGGPANVIAAAERILAQGGDPWPNCPDPGDGGTWQQTKDCESPGYSWYEDPPGYFCGPLQFDPAYWGDVIRRYGIPC